MKRIQQRIGLGEPVLDDEHPRNHNPVDLVETTPITDPVTLQLPALTESRPDPSTTTTHTGNLAPPRRQRPRPPPRTARADSDDPTTPIQR